MEDKIFLSCVYTYEENGESKTDEYKSPKHYDKSIKIDMKASILVREIKNETGRIVKNFITITEKPVISKTINQVGDIKTKNGVSLNEIVYEIAVTEEEIKEAKERRESLQNIIVDMMYDYYKKK